MTFEELLNAIIADLGPNFNEDDTDVLSSIIYDVVEDALLMSNRKSRAYTEELQASHVYILSSNIKKAVKTIYLQRGIEDVRSNSQSGLSNTYTDAMDVMLRDIIRQNKRLFA